MTMQAQRIAGFASLGLGLGIAASSILGPLVLRVIKFHASRNIENQFVGGEIASLTLVAPGCMAAGALWLRQHRLAPAIALGTALYAVYTYSTVIVGQEYRQYEGNVEKAFPLYAGIVAGAAAITAYAWSQLDARLLPEPSEHLRRALGIGFVSLGGFFALAWTAQIAAVLRGNPPADYQDAPTLFWLIKLLDFGFCIPALVATGTGLLRRSQAAIKPAYALAGFGTCLMASVAGMAVAMTLKDDPSAEPVMLAVTIPATTGLAVATWRLLQAYARQSATSREAVHA